MWQIEKICSLRRVKSGESLHLVIWHEEIDWINIFFEKTKLVRMVCEFTWRQKELDCVLEIPGLIMFWMHKI